MKKKQNLEEMDVIESEFCYLKQAMKRVSIPCQPWRMFWAPFSFLFSYFIILAWVVFSFFLCYMIDGSSFCLLLPFWGMMKACHYLSSQKTTYCTLITLSHITMLQRRDKVTYQRFSRHALLFRDGGCDLYMDNTPDIIQTELFRYRRCTDLTLGNPGPEVAAIMLQHTNTPAECVRCGPDALFRNSVFVAVRQ